MTYSNRGSIGICIYPTFSTRKGWDTRSIFQWLIASLNIFSFSKSGYRNNEPVCFSLAYVEDTIVRLKMDVLEVFSLQFVQCIQYIRFAIINDSLHTHSVGLKISIRCLAWPFHIEYLPQAFLMNVNCPCL